MLFVCFLASPSSRPRRQAEATFFFLSRGLPRGGGRELGIP